MPGHWGRSRSSSRGSAAPGGTGGGGWSPGVGGQQHQPKAKAAPVSTGGGRSAALQAIAAASAKKALPPQLGGSGTAAQAAKVSGVPLGGAGLPPQLGGPSSAAQAAKFTGAPVIPKGRTHPGGIPGGAWKRHAEFTNYLKAMRAKNYHQLGGLDFKTRFSSIPNWAAKGLGYGYQGVTEGLRGLGKYLTGDPGAMSDAYSRALEEGRLNALGIEQFGTGSPLEQKYLAERDYYETLARGGLAGLYRYGGFI